MFFVINITSNSLCYPVLPVCKISAKQLLIKRYLKRYTQTTPVQITLFVCTINNKLAFSCCSVPVISVSN